MTRIIAGSARGRRLTIPPGRDTRPTADRTREALLSSIQSLHGSLAGARLLDLYAGSGAVGLEALSRGAEHVLLVERDRAALSAIRSNIAALGLPGAEVSGGAVERLLAGANPRERYDVVFLDPPYAMPAEDLAAVLVDLLHGDWLADQALVVVERATRNDPWVWPAGFHPDRSRAYGEGSLWYGHASVEPTQFPDSRER